MKSWRGRLLLIPLVLFSAAFIAYRYLALPASSHGEEKVFVVRSGEGSASIGRRLEEEGLIRSRCAFWLSLYHYQLQNKIQAGSFRLSPQMSLKEIGFSLTRGRLDQWFRVLEGVRREEVADQAEKELSFSKEEFLLASEGKEGYLFPDSYLIPLKASSSQVVKTMTDNFDQKTEEIWTKGEERGLREKEILILASLVEREAKTDQDRLMVASILIRRWKNDWPLQVDATVQYAKASLNCPSQEECSWWPKVSSLDLKIASPYNTYQQTGLPPAPVCNPSLSSLRAVVNYQETEYWFYLSDGEGKLHYGRTNGEHNANIERYLN